MQGDVLQQIVRWQQRATYDFKAISGCQLSLSKLSILPEDILDKKAETIE